MAKYKKQKSDNFIINLTLFPYDVMVSLGQTDDEFKDSLNIFDGLEWDDEMKTSGPAKYFMLSGNQSVIRLRDYPTTNTCYGYIQHEIFHCVMAILAKMGVTCTDSSEEVYAYMTEYLTEQIYDRI